MSYDSLYVFLTSAEHKVNFTVSTGPGLLIQVLKSQAAQSST